MTIGNPSRNEPKYLSVKYDGTNADEIAPLISAGLSSYFVDENKTLWVFDANQKKVIETVGTGSWLVYGPYFVDPIGAWPTYRILDETSYQYEFGIPPEPEAPPEPQEPQS